MSLDYKISKVDGDAFLVHAWYKRTAITIMRASKTGIVFHLSHGHAPNTVVSLYTTINRLLKCTTNDDITLARFGNIDDVSNWAIRLPTDPSKAVKFTPGFTYVPRAHEWNNWGAMFAKNAGVKVSASRCPIDYLKANCVVVRNEHGLRIHTRTSGRSQYDCICVMYIPTEALNKRQRKLVLLPDNRRALGPIRDDFGLYGAMRRAIELFTDNTVWLNDKGAVRDGNWTLMSDVHNVPIGRVTYMTTIDIPGSFSVNLVKELMSCAQPSPVAPPQLPTPVPAPVPAPVAPPELPVPTPVSPPELPVPTPVPAPAAPLPLPMLTPVHTPTAPAPKQLSLPPQFMPAHHASRASHVEAAFRSKPIILTAPSACVQGKTRVGPKHAEFVAWMDAIDAEYIAYCRQAKLHWEKLAMSVLEDYNNNSL